MSTLLQIQDLSVGLLGRKAAFPVLTNLDLEVKQGEILGLVGESGSGKTTLAISILGLVDPPFVIQGGAVQLVQNGSSVDLITMSEEKRRELRWRQIAYVPQASMSALNPVLRVRRQMTDTLVQHGMTIAEADERAKTSLQLVNLKPQVLDLYPHQLSGGMTQRVAIAMAISMQPALIIADEPSTALDVVTQRLILQELKQVRDRFGTTIIIISHDMGVIAQVADRMAVMYAGRVAELGSVSAVFDEPLHPYTQGLTRSIPRGSGIPLEGLKGESPNPRNYPTGCRFHPRCPFVMEICRLENPALLEHRAAHLAACHLYTAKEAAHG